MTSVTEDLSLPRPWAEVPVRPMLVVEFVSALSDPTDNKVVRVVLRYCRGGFVFAHLDDDYVNAPCCVARCRQI